MCTLLLVPTAYEGMSHREPLVMAGAGDARPYAEQQHDTSAKPSLPFVCVLHSTVHTCGGRWLPFTARCCWVLPLSLPGFGRAYFSVAPSLFAHEDAAYILAYSVIMLNTDRHNNQVWRRL